MAEFDPVQQTLALIDGMKRLGFSPRSVNLDSESVELGDISQLPPELPRVPESVFDGHGEPE